jgi:MtN3 and saliva related transmembrane protein
MYMLTVGGFGLWLTYGVAKVEWPLIVTNAICLALSTFILFMTLLPSARRREVAAALDPTESHNIGPTRPDDDG